MRCQQITASARSFLQRGIPIIERGLRVARPFMQRKTQGCWRNLQWVSAMPKRGFHNRFVEEGIFSTPSHSRTRVQSARRIFLRRNSRGPNNLRIEVFAILSSTIMCWTLRFCSVAQQQATPQPKIRASAKQNLFRAWCSAHSRFKWTTLLEAEWCQTLYGRSMQVARLDTLFAWQLRPSFKQDPLKTSVRKCGNTDTGSPAPRPRDTVAACSSAFNNQSLKPWSVVVCFCAYQLSSPKPCQWTQASLKHPLLPESASWFSTCRHKSSHPSRQTLDPSLPVVREFRLVVQQYVR